MRIACVADTHLISPDPESGGAFHAYRATLGERGARLREEIRQELDTAFMAVCSYLSDAGPWDAVVHLGDISSGYQGRGCFHKSVQPLYTHCVQALHAASGIPVWCVPGNHCIGTGARLTKENIEAWRARVGGLYWHHFIDGVLLIGISSPTALYQGSDEMIQERSSCQRAFVREVLEQYEGAPWVLFSHNPWGAVAHAFEAAPFVRTLRAVICGDVHRPDMQRVIRQSRFLPFLSRAPFGITHVARRMLSRVIVCPSVAPFWWEGYGMLELELSANYLHGRVRQIPRLANRKALPTEHPLRCAWFVARGAISAHFNR